MNHDLPSQICLRDLVAAVRRTTVPLEAGQVAARADALGRVHARIAADTRAASRLATASGYPEEIVARHLSTLMSALTAERLTSWAERTLRPAADATAFGPGLVVVIAAGTIPLTAVPSICAAVLSGAGCVVKAASRDVESWRLYVEHAPDLVAGLRVVELQGDTGAVELLSAADAVIAYGSDETLASIRHSLPVGAEFIGHGHRLSVGLVPEGVRVREGAQRIAMDIAAFDQDGCLSPQVVFVEGDGSAADAFASALADELASLEDRWPPREGSAAEHAAVHQFRARVALEAITEPGLSLRRSATGTGWTVVVEPRAGRLAGPLRRTVIIRSFTGFDELAAELAPLRSKLLCATVAGPIDHLVPRLVSLGFTRICPAGEAQFPTQPEFHDGVNELARLVRWVTR